MKPCPCPICTVNRSVKAIEAATDTWVEREANLECDHYYLLDEVRAALSTPWWKRPRRHLREALHVLTSTKPRAHQEDA